MSTKHRTYPYSAEHFDHYPCAQPVTPTEALMQASPFEDPRESILEQMPRLEEVKFVIDQLPEKHRWVMEAVYYRQLPLRKIGRELGYSKTHVARLRDEGHQMVRKLLAKNEARRTFRHLN